MVEDVGIVEAAGGGDGRAKAEGDGRSEADGGEDLVASTPPIRIVAGHICVPANTARLRRR